MGSVRVWSITILKKINIDKLNALFFWQPSIFKSKRDDNLGTLLKYENAKQLKIVLAGCLHAHVTQKIFIETAIVLFGQGFRDSAVVQRV